MTNKENAIANLKNMKYICESGRERHINKGDIPWIKEAIEALEQESKTGHWKALGNYDYWGNESSYKCSKCDEINTYPDNFCPNCGAKMKGVEE